MTPAMLTTTQVAEMLGLSRRRVLQLIETGRLRAEALGLAGWLIPADAVGEVEFLPVGRPPKSEGRVPVRQVRTLGRTHREKKKRKGRRQPGR